MKTKISKDDLYRFAMKAEEVADDTEASYGSASIDKISELLGIERDVGDIAYRLAQRKWAECDFGTNTFALREFGRDEIERIRANLALPKWRQWVEDKKAYLAWIGATLFAFALDALKHWLWK